MQLERKPQKVARDFLYLLFPLKGRGKVLNALSSAFWLSPFPLERVRLFTPQTATFRSILGKNFAAAKASLMLAR